VAHHDGIGEKASLPFRAGRLNCPRPKPHFSSPDQNHGFPA
jgi:hypothetical protein